MLDMDGHTPHIYMNDEDAAARGITYGDEVTAFNGRGEHSGLAWVTKRVKKGVVVLENGWDDSIGASSSNAVTSAAYPTLGTINCRNSTLVDVRKGA